MNRARASVSLTLEAIGTLLRPIWTYWSRLLKCILYA